MTDPSFGPKSSWGDRQPRPMNRAAAANVPAFSPRPEFLARMEAAFGESFSNVTFRASRLVDARFGGIAVTVGDTILTGERFPALSPLWRERILAHELAHVVQKRRPANASARASRDPRYRARLEAEAHRAAGDAMAGRPARCRLSDIPEIPAPWGPAGHYWTCFFVMLAAGVNEEEAEQRAFFCQMPDQVREFDASRAAVDWTEVDLGIDRGSARRASRQGLLYSAADRAHGPGIFAAEPGYGVLMSVLDQEKEGLAETMARRQVDLDIADGLHCLSGDAAGEELSYREEQLKTFADDPLVFGLALHAYGDCYAYQDANTGNVAREQKVEIARGAAGRAGANKNDGARAGPSTLYSGYVANLYRIVCETLKTDRQRQISQSATLDALRPLNGMQFLSQTQLSLDAAIQRMDCSAIRDAIRKMLNRAPGSRYSFTPEEEAQVYWREFWPLYSALITGAGGEQWVFDQVQKTGFQWRS